MEVLAVEAAVSAGNVTITTTTEKAIISSNVMAQERQTANYLIKAWAQVTTGTSITGMTAKIRRGTTITDTLVNEANIITVGAAAGSNEVFTAWAMETLADVASVQYTLCLLQTAADGNGTVLQSGIEVTQMA